MVRWLMNFDSNQNQCPMVDSSPCDLTVVCTLLIFGGRQRLRDQYGTNAHKDETSGHGFSRGPGHLHGLDSYIQERSTLGIREVELLIIVPPWIPTIRRILDPPRSACSALGTGSKGQHVHPSDRHLGDTRLHGTRPCLA